MVDYYEEYEKRPAESGGKDGLIALILGIISLLTGSIGSIIGIIAIVFGVKGKEFPDQRAMSICGIVCGAVSLVKNILLFLCVYIPGIAFIHHFLTNGFFNSLHMYL